jgi:predicted ArsR family transcriptional regulator
MADLLDIIADVERRYPVEAGFKRTDTSREAAERIDAKTLRAKVLATINLHGPLTADEAAARLNMSILSIRPRCTELRELGKLEDSGERRLNASGRKAIVWRIPVAEMRLAA